jgi:predicted flavoprotein YhiN
VNQIKKGERNKVVNLLKAFPLTVTGSLSIEKAMVTCGGISRKEIDPQTMESKLVSGIYFAGEIIDFCAPSGGYNLQEAFSTGYLAGEMAANSLD